MCNLYLFCRVLRIRSFMHILVSIEIRVMRAVKQLIEGVIL